MELDFCAMRRQRIDTPSITGIASGDHDWWHGSTPGLPIIPRGTCELGVCVRVRMCVRFVRARTCDLAGEPGHGSWTRDETRVLRERGRERVWELTLERF